MQEVLTTSCASVAEASPPGKPLTYNKMGGPWNIQPGQLHEQEHWLKSQRRTFEGMFELDEINPYLVMAPVLCGSLSR